jgi:hypothetical protein
VTIKSYAGSGVQRLISYEWRTKIEPFDGEADRGERTERRPIMKPESHHWNVSSTRIERVRIVGPINERRQCFAWLDENGFEIRRSGPYTSSEMRPEYDNQRFLVEADKKEGEAMDSQARDFMLLGIQIKGLNIKLAHVMLALMIVMLVWLVALTVQLTNLKKRVETSQQNPDKRVALIESRKPTEHTPAR